jgi:hypothetical protein
LIPSEGHLNLILPRDHSPFASDPHYALHLIVGRSRAG